MNAPLNVLVLEDRESDARLMLQELRGAGYVPRARRVDTEAGYAGALDSSVELILADYSIPGWDTMQALALLKARGLDIPFIIVSGSIREEEAIAAMREGAADYLLKDRLTRLGPAVQHALDARRLRAERERTVQALADSEARYRLLFEANPHPMWVFDLETLAFLAVNDAAIAHYGYTREEFLAMTIEQIRPEAELPALRRRLAEKVTTELRAGTWRHCKRDGTVIDVELTSHGVDFAGRPARLVLAHDVTARLVQERRIARLSRMRAVLVAINSALLRLRGRDEILQAACTIAVTEGEFTSALARVLDPASGALRIVASAGAASAYAGDIEATTAPDVPGGALPSSRALRERHIVVNSDVASDPSLAEFRERLLADGVASVAACPLLVEEQPVAVLLLCSEVATFFDADEHTLLEVLTADLSLALDRASKADRLDFLALYDAVTGLPNQRLFEQHLGQLVTSARTGGRQVCVAVLDLDGFTRINDGFGRAVGDELLQLIGARLAAEIDAPMCLARIGADTFAVARACPDPDLYERLRLGIHAALARPFALAGQSIAIDAQLGLAMFPQDGSDAQAVFKAAEAALAQGRAAGDRDRHFSREGQERIDYRVKLEAELRSAIDAGEFVLHYQPKVDLVSGELTGAEALIRWQHPRDGLIPPARFIGVAEEAGLIGAIGEWVVENACAQHAAWATAGLVPVPISVNLSPLQLRTPGLVAKIRAAIARHGVEPRCLELELTETAVMADPDEAAATLRGLREVGIGLALDDFGTGYSSLSHLKRFPFDTVKIDRSFVEDITRNADDAAIASAIIAMSHRLGLRVVAEGIETEAQLAYLRAQHCDEMQGNYFSPPLDAADFAARVRSGWKLSLPPQDKAGVRTVLVVDDDPGMRSTLNRVLRRDKYRILLAESGPHALELLATNPVQVIVADQRMAPMPGTEFLSIASRLYPDTLRILLSGYTDLATVTEAVNRGAVFKFMVKPWDDEDLRAQVRDAFRRYRPAA